MRNRDQYVLPGGGVDPGESPEACAERECTEELGLIVRAQAPVGMVREYYNGILRFENLYLRAEWTGERVACARTEEEIGLGITETWIPTESVRAVLGNTQSHLMPFEIQVEHVHRAIANCHMRELLGIACVLDWPWEPISRLRASIEGITVTCEEI